MACAGMVPSEHSSGSHTRRGPMTKSGNAHLRRAVIESGWHYRHKPVVSDAMRKRQREAPAAACLRANESVAARARSNLLAPSGGG